MQLYPIYPGGLIKCNKTVSRRLLDWPDDICLSQNQVHHCLGTHGEQEATTVQESCYSDIFGFVRDFYLLKVSEFVQSLVSAWSWPGQFIGSVTTSAIRSLLQQIHKALIFAGCWNTMQQLSTEQIVWVRKFSVETEVTSLFSKQKWFCVHGGSYFFLQH